MKKLILLSILTLTSCAGISVETAERSLNLNKALLKVAKPKMSVKEVSDVETFNKRFQLEINEAK